MTDNPDDWHPVKEAMYDVNDLFDQVETNEARAHIDDAVIHLKGALEAEREYTDTGDK